MFSRAELEFLKGASAVSPAYERVLLHRIQKKTKSLSSTLHLLAQNEKTKSLFVELFSVTENSNCITDFSNSGKAQDESLFKIRRISESPGRDSDPRPTAYEAAAPTGLSYRGKSIRS